MSGSVTGLFAGLLLAVAALVGGFNGFLLALVLGLVGWLIGAALTGELNLESFRSGRGRG
ncbi:MULTISPECIES: DUF2273 domain-containing protein [Georgenia]|jgi:uncharacterized membrane protein YeaQ/YmgE (transglycosylase-associated protein family)|uniref:DUF2273 domain-containing protein n=1 Tax=Georgenia thermotolerans TaxID=527326 RepID=A0A7J5UT63_9MICO|nr:MULTISPECIES: DUF2273 domain-containing protein [Georgenia]KAE8765471.1 DUF2273 domain-containing protein [Georgenia thermotolerans]